MVTLGSCLRKGYPDFLSLHRGALTLHAAACPFWSSLSMGSSSHCGRTASWHWSTQQFTPETTQREQAWSLAGMRQLKPLFSPQFCASILQIICLPGNTHRSTGNLRHSLKASLPLSFPQFFIQTFIICILSYQNHTSVVESTIRKML